MPKEHSKNCPTRKFQAVYKCTCGASLEPETPAIHNEDCIDVNTTTGNLQCERPETPPPPKCHCIPDVVKRVAVVHRSDCSLNKAQPLDEINENNWESHYPIPKEAPKAQPEEDWEAWLDNFCQHISDWSYNSAHEVLTERFQAEREKAYEEKAEAVTKAEKEGLAHGDKRYKEGIESREIEILKIRKEEATHWHKEGYKEGYEEGELMGRVLESKIEKYVIEKAKATLLNELEEEIEKIKVFTLNGEVAHYLYRKAIVALINKYRK